MKVVFRIIDSMNHQTETLTSLKGLMDTHFHTQAMRRKGETSKPSCKGFLKPDSRGASISGWMMMICLCAPRCSTGFRN